MKSLHSDFSAHILKYVGIGMISGSIVHAGTLGGDSLRYIVLIVAGIIAFVSGTLIEHNQQISRQLVLYIGISVLISIGTGMVSGGVQHYLDGPMVAAFLIPVGLFCAYVFFGLRDYKGSMSLKNISLALLSSILLGVILFGAANIIAPLENSDNHHSR